MVAFVDSTDAMDMHPSMLQEHGSMTEALSVLRALGRKEEVVQTLSRMLSLRPGDPCTPPSRG